MPQGAEKSSKGVHLNGFLSRCLRDADALREMLQHLNSMAGGDEGKDETEEVDRGLNNLRRESRRTLAVMLVIGSVAGGDRVSDCGTSGAMLA